MATKTKDLRGMSDEQLGLTLKDTEKHLFQLRFQSATDRLETPSEIRKAQARHRPGQDGPARTRTDQARRICRPNNWPPASRLSKAEGEGGRARQAHRSSASEAAQAVPRGEGGNQAGGRAAMKGSGK